MYNIYYILDMKNNFKTHVYLLKIFRFLYRGFVSTIRMSRNIKQKSTQQLIQTN